MIQIILLLKEKNHNLDVLEYVHKIIFKTENSLAVHQFVKYHGLTSIPQRGISRAKHCDIKSLLTTWNMGKLCWFSLRTHCISFYHEQIYSKRRDEIPVYF